MASAIVLTLSCSSDDNSSNNANNNSSKITPPAWIQGTWKPVETPSGLSYRFSNNNLCQVNVASEVCMKEYIELYENASGQVYTNVEQRISDSEYYCKITVASASNIYHFEKISNNTIKDVIMSNSVGSTVLLKRDQVMNNKNDDTAKILTIVVCLLIAFQIIRSCNSKSDSHNGYHRSDPEMNRVSRD